MGYLFWIRPPMALKSTPFRPSFDTGDTGDSLAVADWAMSVDEVTVDHGAEEGSIELLKSGLQELRPVLQVQEASS